MKTKHLAARFILAFFLLWAISASATEKTKTAPGVEALGATTIQVKTPKGEISVQLPLSSPEYAEVPVAEVNGEPIVLSELNSQLISSKTGKAGHQNLQKILDRIINLRLLAEEARNIGFDESPEFVKQKESYKDKVLRKLLQRQELPEVAPSKDKVAQLYKKMSTVVKLESIAFRKKEDAEKAFKEIKGGAAYDDVVKKALKDKTAQGSLLGARSYSFDQLMPQILDFVKDAKSGALSKPIHVGKEGYALIKVAEAVKTVDNPEIKDKAFKQLLAKQNLASLRAYFEKLKKKYAIVHQKTIDSIDFAAEKPGFEALQKDNRPIIEIKGEAPITVADFTNAMGGNLYHGTDTKENRTRMNGMKKVMEQNMLYKKVFHKEAIALGLDKTEQFKKAMKSFERMSLFNSFVNQVIVPDARVKEQTVHKYYEDHIDVYSSPEMLRMKSLIFDNAGSAQHALDLLQKGTDLNWLSANAEHQVKKDTKGLMQFDDAVLSVTALPKDVQETVAGVKQGDFRLYKGPAGNFYVLAIDKVFPPEPTPYKDVREAIAKKLFNENIPKQIEEWAKKLKKAYEVKVYLVDTEKTK